MLKNINWDGVKQSITDTWMPLIIITAVAALAVIIIHFIRRRKHK